MALRAPLPRSWTGRVLGSIAAALLVWQVLEWTSGNSGSRTTGGDVDAREVEVRVVKVVDGDTIRVRYGGRVEPVRYIGIDTPEWDHPEDGRQPFAREATELNRRLVGGRTVHLRFGQERRDDYDRWLAYVYLADGTFVNEELVERGLAEALTIPPNVRHSQRFEALERDARRADRGMWGR